MQKKEEVDLLQKKISKKNSSLWFRASYLYKKIIFSGREAGQSRAALSLTLGSLRDWASLLTG